MTERSDVHDLALASISKLPLVTLNVVCLRTAAGDKHGANISSFSTNFTTQPYHTYTYTPHPRLLVTLFHELNPLAVNSLLNIPLNIPQNTIFLSLMYASTIYLWIKIAT